MSSGIGILFQVQSAPDGIYVTDKTIKNFRIGVSNANCTDAFVVDGGDNSGANLGYFYASEITNINIAPYTSGNGFVIRNNFFESSVTEIDVRKFGNTTGYMMLLDQSAGSTGVISSLKLDGIKTDGGNIGLWVKSPISDFWLTNVTSIRAQREGILLDNLQSNVVRNIHLEANWQSVGSLVVGNAALRAVLSNGGGVFDGVYAPTTGGGYQAEAVRVYVAAGSVATIIGGIGGGLSYARLVGAAGSGAVLLGPQSYSSDGVIKVVRLSGYLNEIFTISPTNGVTTEGTRITNIGSGAESGSNYSMAVSVGDSAGFNAAATVLRLNKNSVTNRSVNAAGTVNASGADYAEYEYNNGLVIQKGAIVGFKSDGTLTLTFSEAVRFGIKSTNPSYVGGDTWGSGIEGDELEAARQQVDRIAYSGKVPCNVIGAMPGGYIVAIDNAGSIAGEFFADPDFVQYKNAVGRVNRILGDGRCEVAVMVH